jgi:hypothetical protein
MASEGGSYSLTVDPTTVGDALILQVQNYTNDLLTTAVAGGGVSSWASLIAYQDSVNGWDIELWLGTVTATGSATVTITTSSGVTYCTLACQQFTAGAPATWTQDGSGGSSYQGAGATSGNYPSLTPGGSGELYVGTLATEYVASGSTSGYTYDEWAPSLNFAQFAYNGSVSSPTAQSPNWSTGINATPSVAVSALVVATLPFMARGGRTVVGQAVNRASTYMKRTSGILEPCRRRIFVPA